MFSVDVESLLTNVPVTETLRVLEANLLGSEMVMLNGVDLIDIGLEGE